ncbi:MAG: 50S ribosome-binding GTPase [archaeon]|nr:50S ribosome-binding GTPase [archaeon]
MITAALVGNPNSGKTTVFNRLTGSIQHVGNWPGVTVERKQGFIRGTADERILVVDLPGIYSLSPYSPEEVVSRDYLIGNGKERPDVAVNLIDASNLERGLYLYTQIADLGIPVVVVLNMVDVAEKSGMAVDAGALSEALGCEVVETVGTKGIGTRAVSDVITRAHRLGKGS